MVVDYLSMSSVNLRSLISAQPLAAALDRTECIEDLGILEFLATPEADAVGPFLDGEHATELSMMAPKR